MSESVHTVVIGGGVAGLATTRCLLDKGIEVLALDENEQIGHSWRRRYDNLRLNSVRWLSHMPGLPLPKQYGRWVHRDDVVEYVTAYARPIEHAVRTGVRALRVERGAASRWCVTTSLGTIEAHNVIIATGLYGTPATPDWSGRDSFRGRLLHAANYLRPDDFDGEHVVVIGAGVSGVDIAIDLLSRQSGSLTVAVRTPPHFLPRELWTLPLQGLSVANKHLPIALQDLGAQLIQWLAVGNLDDTRLGRPTEGMFRRLQRTGVSPAVDDGIFVPAVRAGKVEVIDEVVDLYADGVLTRSGRQIATDTVIAATGYRTGLHDLLGDLSVLDVRGIPPQYGRRNKRWADQGLFFVGFSSPLTGHLREIGLLARRTAKSIKRQPAVPPAIARETVR